MVERTPRLTVRNFSKTYRTGRTNFDAVKDISFEIIAGECYGLLGPNGAGKSTTINCISGFYPATSGQIEVESLNVYTAPKAARQILGVCQQEDTLDTDFNCLDQLVRHASFFRIPKKEAIAKASDLLDRFGLGDQKKSEVDALSGGMRRKLQVARALISSPRVLVLDEPTTGLDPDARRLLWDILFEQRKGGLAILLSTHYMDEAERLCDRIGILEKGKILDEDTPPNLIKKHITRDVIEEEIRPGVKWKRAPNLEDVFLKLTGRKLGGEA